MIEIVSDSYTRSSSQDPSCAQVQTMQQIVNNTE